MTGGGDAPGLNAVIRAVVKAGASWNCETIGIEDGFDGLLERDRWRRLTPRDVTGILRIGGTILGTVNRGNPFAKPVQTSDGPRAYSDRCVEIFKDMKLDALVVIGGDGTLYQKWWDGRRWNPGDADFHWHGDTKLQAGSLSVIGAPGFRDVYAMDQSGQLIHKFWTADGGWSQWFGLGGICSAVSVVRVDGVTDIYVRGQDGTLFQKWWDGQRWNPGDADFHWHGADFRMQPNSLSVIAAPGFRDLYAINLNGQLCHRYWTASGGWSQWFGLGGVCSAVAAVATGDKTDMYVRGQDGTLFQKWWDGRQHMPGPADFFWHGTGLRMRPKALSVIGWKGFRDVYALDPNGQLCHKYFA